MSLYRKFFEKILNEDGPNYAAHIPNTAGRGGALGNSSNMYTNGSASGTTGTDIYASGDYRIPTSIFGGIIRRQGTKKNKKHGSRTLANKSRNKRK